MSIYYIDPAYGEGDMPTFCGSVDVSERKHWQPSGHKNIWKCTEEFRGNVGNLVFNENECTATLRRSMDVYFRSAFVDTGANPCYNETGKGGAL